MLLSICNCLQTFKKSLELSLSLQNQTKKELKMFVGSYANISTSFNLILNRVQEKKQNVGNKAKGQISKRVFQENKARRIFRKMNISYPLISKCKHPF